MNRNNNRSGIFLMEITLAIVFFSLAGALCLQMFAKSRQTSRDSANLAQASGHVQNAAELIKSAASSAFYNTEHAFSLDCLMKEYSEAVTHSDKTEIFFDEAWSHCAKEKGIYCMEAAPSQTLKSNLFCCRLTVYEINSGNSIYSLDLKVHIPNSPY